MLKATCVPVAPGGAGEATGFWQYFQSSSCLLFVHCRTCRKYVALPRVRPDEDIIFLVFTGMGCQHLVGARSDMRWKSLAAYLQERLIRLLLHPPWRQCG